MYLTIVSMNTKIMQNLASVFFFIQFVCFRCSSRLTLRSAYVCLLVFSFTTSLVPLWAAPPTDEHDLPDPQHAEQSQESAWIDQFQDGIEHTVDATARWIDAFFGDSRHLENSLDTHGYLAIAPRWSAYEGWKVDSSFRAQFQLPHAKQRFSAIIGRGSFDDLVNHDDPSYRPSILESMKDDKEWILGLGFNPDQGESNRFYFSAGIRGGIHADPYIQARHLLQRALSEHSQLRFRSSLFWRNSDGFGFNYRTDWETSYSEAWLTRLTLDFTLAQRTKGVRWRHKAAVYHLYAEQRALATEVFFEGENEQRVSLQDVGLRLIHRKQWLREWMFLELWGGMHWPKELPEEVRERRWMLGLEISLWYG